MRNENSPTPLSHSVRRRGIVAAVAGAALALALASCSADGAPTPAATATGASDELAGLYEEAQAEGTLIWYTGMIPANLDQIKLAFETEFPGITLQVFRLIGTEGLVRFTGELEAGAPSADVFTSAIKGFAADALAEGWAVDLADADIPTLDDYPAEYVRDAEIVVQVAPVRVSINTDGVTDLPETWEDLLDPQYADQTMIWDPRAEMKAMAQFSLLYDTYGAEFLEKLAANGFRAVNSPTPAAQALAAGEGYALWPSLDSVANPLIVQGAPIENVALAPYTGVENTAFISAEAPHPAAARLFLSWIATPEGQTAINGGFAGSPMPGIPDTVELGDDYVAWSMEDVEGNRAAVLGALGIE